VRVADFAFCNLEFFVIRSDNHKKLLALKLSSTCSQYQTAFRDLCLAGVILTAVNTVPSEDGQGFGMSAYIHQRLACIVGHWTCENNLYLDIGSPGQNFFVFHCQVFGTVSLFSRVPVSRSAWLFVSYCRTLLTRFAGLRMNTP
jgi:hypothetical protein